MLQTDRARNLCKNITLLSNSLRAETNLNMDGFKHINYTVETKNIEESILKLLRIIKPKWKEHEVQLQVGTVISKF